MDGICRCALEKICELAPLGRYVVVSADELTESFPEDTEKSCTELTKALKSLASDGYIDLKYRDGEFFCLTALKKFIPPEPKPAPKPNPNPEAVTAHYSAKKKNFWLSGKTAAFWAAFAGGLLGGAAGSLIISLIFAAV